MIISISGTAGSGKSSVAKYVAKKLRYKHYSVGDLRRELAAKKGMSIEELNKLGESDPSTDNEPDEYQEELGKREDNFVIDSRLAFHFIPRSFKVFIDGNEELRAERIMKDTTRVGENLGTVEEAVAKIRERQASDIKRYEKYYHLNPYEKKHYDLIVDSNGKTVEECGEVVLECIKSNSNN